MTNEVMLRQEMQPGGVYTDLHTEAIPRFVSFKPDGKLSVWYVCTTDAFNSPKYEAWGFAVVATGEPIETDYSYLGSAVDSHGLVSHVYGGKL